MHIDIKKEIKSSNWGIAGIVIIATIIAVALFGPLFLPYKPLAQSTDIFFAPCAAHWLGTNHVGQDVFTQLVYGARTSLLVGFHPSSHYFWRIHRTYQWHLR
jgi:peptide/nickel transport system permease protein